MPAAVLHGIIGPMQIDNLSHSKDSSTTGSPRENWRPASGRRFLLINPNTNLQTTERLCSVLMPQLPPDASLEVRTATFGSTYIACEASHAVASHACLDAWATHRQQDTQPLDGVLIGCFGDPGLFALRESSGCPVTGLAEAAFMAASQRGAFAVVTGGERWKPMLERLAISLGHGAALKHIATVKPSGAELQADPAMAMECLTQACQQAAAHGVQSIIVGGAGLAGYARQLQSRVPLPLIDSVEAGLQALLENRMPAPRQSSDGFVANWINLSAGMLSMKRPANLADQ